MTNRRRRSISITLAAAIACIAALAACSDAENAQACYPGDQAWCTCADGARGIQSCASGGGSYGACNCNVSDAGSVTDAAGDDAAADAGDATDSGKLPFMSPCAMNSDCATNLCFMFNAKGPHCSHPCNVDSDCEPPSPGCSNMKVCKAP
jgi:hypothetical protein